MINIDKAHKQELFSFSNNFWGCRRVLRPKSLRTEPQADGKPHWLVTAVPDHRSPRIPPTPETVPVPHSLSGSATATPTTSLWGA